MSNKSKICEFCKRTVTRNSIIFNDKAFCDKNCKTIFISKQITKRSEEKRITIS